MTERGLPIVDGAPACPFVAFADERDERATSPDHRHRCYAEVEPAPRALAHQEAYCLSSAFPVCPTFQDWARREAARTATPAGPVAAPRPDAGRGQPDRAPAPMRPSERPTAGTPLLSGRADAGQRPPASGAGIDGSDRGRIGGPPGLSGTVGAAGAAGAAGGIGAAAVDGVPGAAAGAAGRGGGGGPERGRGLPGSGGEPPAPGAPRPGPSAGDVDAPGFLVRRTQPGGGLAGSGADRLASAGERARSGGDGGVPPADAPRGPQTPLAGGQRGLAGTGSGRRRDEFDDDFDEDLDSRDGWRDSSGRGQAPATTTDRIRSAFGVGSDRRPSVGDTRPRSAADVPAARQPPRRNNAHPTNRTRLGTPAVSRLAVIALALVIAAIALYFLPELLMGRDRGDNGGVGGAPSASAPAAGASASVEPSVSAAPSPQVYVVQEGDTLEKIREQFGLTLAELRAANPQITNPDLIAIGDEILIPQGEPAASAGASPDAEPSAGASP